MFTVHPQRWINNPMLWMRELVWQNPASGTRLKNYTKKMITDYEEIKFLSLSKV